MENKAITIQEKTVTDNVLARLNALQKDGNIIMPKNYSYQNALKSAYLKLVQTVDKEKRPVLQSCSKESICNSLLDMCIQGLSPAKNQCYFIAFGGKLTLMKSYLGNIAATKRLHGVKNVFANCIYKDDVFEYTIDLETGNKKIVKHEQKFGNIHNDKIIGAYAVVVMEGDIPNYIEMMPIDEIRSAWQMGAAKGNSDAHKKFTDEMAKKTVINRACKRFVYTSDDSDVLVESITRTNEYNPEDIIETNDNTVEEVKEELRENANKEVINVNPKSEQVDMEFD